jgi:hypothetical protein
MYLVVYKILNMVNRSSIILCVTIFMYLESMNTHSVKTDRKKFLMFGREVANRFLFGPKSSVFSLFIFQWSGTDLSKVFYFYFQDGKIGKIQRRNYFMFVP